MIKVNENLFINVKDISVVNINAYTNVTEIHMKSSLNIHTRTPIQEVIELIKLEGFNITEIEDPTDDNI